MLEKLVELHNLMVKPEDRVIIVGDVCNKDTPEQIKNVELFNGRKILIRGNHDVNLTDSDLKDYFEEVIPDGDGIELEVDGLKCYATHYPTR